MAERIQTFAVNEVNSPKAENMHFKGLGNIMKIKTILLASTITFLGFSAANAADAIQYQEPTPAIAAPSFTWNGAYIGGQIGYGWGKSHYTSLLNSGELKPNGFLGGIYAGYNFALENNFVLGADIDVTYNDLKSIMPTSQKNSKPNCVGQVRREFVRATQLTAFAIHRGRRSWSGTEQI